VLNAVHNCDDRRVDHCSCLLDSVNQYSSLTTVVYYMGLLLLRQIRRIISPLDKTLAKLCS